MTTPTPRTDAVEIAHGLAWFGLHDEQGRYLDGMVKFRELARQLERDLAAAQERIAQLEAERGEYEGSTLQQLDNLIHELTGDEGEDDSFTVLRRKWSNLESNRKDAERYRWLREPQDHICVSVEKRDWDIDEMFWTNEFEALVRAELDAAIDAAIAGEQK